MNETIIDREIKLKVESGNVNSRLDNFVLDNLKDFTRSQIKKLIDDGLVTIDGKQKKAGEKLKLNQIVMVRIPKPTEISLEKENIPLEIIYQDNDFAIINKPQGMVVHPAVGNYRGTLVNALLYNLTDLSGINGEIRPGIVHRLDKDTSGLLVVAKNDKAHLNLSKQIQSKECRRIYRAIVVGNIKQDEGRIVTYIGRSDKDRKKMAVTTKEKGKVAITLFRVLERFKGYTYVEFELKTGRTHQIRVHCSSELKTPILGDFTYAPKQKNIFKLNGQLLHAYKLILFQPTTNEEMEFECDLPLYFKNVLNNLRQKFKNWLKHLQNFNK